VTVLRSGSATHVGRVRPVNQDVPLERSNLFAVADGMGGHVGGEVAARVAVETLEQAFERAPTTGGLYEAFSEANTAVWRESLANEDLRGMGTTLTALALVGGGDGKDVLALANVGDSRAYVFSDEQMVQVTNDHSLAEERMRHGEITEAEAAVHPQRHILTRALGVSSEVETDMWELHLRSGDRVLLCSDGLSNEVDPHEMSQVLDAVADPGEAAQRLVDVANANGGSDNITVVIVDVQVGEDMNGSAALVTPIGRATSPPTAATPAVGDSGSDPAGTSEAAPDDDEEGDRPAGAAAGPEAATAALTTTALLTQQQPASDARPDDTLAPGAQLGFGERRDQATLADVGPHSDEFFLGSPTAAVPVARSTARVPPQAQPQPPGARTDEKESRGERRRRLGIPRRITFRVLGFVILVAAVPIGAYYATRWYAYDNWVVTSQGTQIVVKQGQPGGVLWFHPKVVYRSPLTTGDVPPVAVGALHAGVQKSSLAKAKSYINGLATTTTSTTTTTTTTAAVPPPTTVPPATAGTPTAPAGTP
jgi:PPM family protein phosphatase